MSAFNAILFAISSVMPLLEFIILLLAVPLLLLSIKALKKYLQS